MTANGDIGLRGATASDWHHGRSLLRAAGLPTEDLDQDKLSGFLVAEKEGQIVGMIGLETFGAVGLLRSLVVADEARRLGVGRLLVEALESSAAAARLTQLWLLTNDAQDFFARFGFEIVERAGAPQAIQSTDEFAELCPDSAFLMVKHLI